MAIPAEIKTLINRLNQELEETEREATEGVNALRPTLWLFPENAILTQLFANLNNVLFFVETYRKRIQRIENILTLADATPSEIRSCRLRISNYPWSRPRS